MASVLCSEGKQDPDVMAANATSAALMLSDIPWGWTHWSGTHGKDLWTVYC